MMKPVEVKICGVTRVEDAVLAVELGAKYIGLNFWPGSPRYLTVEQAKPLAEVAAGRARLVGVWVDPVRREVAAIADELSLDLLQFHGRLNRQVVSSFPGRVIRALRLEPDFDADELGRYKDAWGFLFDCAPAGIFGGSGRSWPYERIASLETEKPVLLAGGLSAVNVADAIRRSRAGIVDVCSAIEVAAGVKDPDLLQQFFREVHHAQTPE